MSEPNTKSPADLLPFSEDSEHGADQVRRRLLRAAAAAPLMATLPSGAAYANVSAFQCVVSSKSSSDAGSPLLSRSGRDQWVRQVATSRRFRTTMHGFAEIKDGWLIGSTWYDAQGNIFVPNLGVGCSIVTDYCPVGSPATVYVLVIYQPVPNGINPTSVNVIGIYPQYSIPSNRPSQVNNIGLFVSCMCSVAPGSNPSGFYCH